MKTNDIYFASPFFRPSQIEREERLKAKLREFGFSVFSPKENCNLSPISDPEIRDKVFKANCDNINSSKCVFAITDEKDMGTIWETGYAFANKKPIIYYAETLGENGQFNLMLANSGNVCVTKFEDLTKELVEKVINEGFKKDFEGIIE